MLREDFSGPFSGHIKPKRSPLAPIKALRTPLLKHHPLTPTPDCGSGCIASKDPIADRRRIRSFDEGKTYDIPKVQATITMPSNWKRHIQQTLKEQLTYRNFRVSSTSAEYSAIASLLEPVRIASVEKIANPTLWDQFEKKRKDMIKSKSDDVNVLMDIGYSKKDIKAVLQYSKDFKLNPKVASVPYNDNMALLFHCTRNKESIDSILTTGLDERMGSGGLLGRGIYFADNPKKSMTYDGCGVIFIMAVLLGDCLSMDKRSETALVREPKKQDEQKRNFNDLIFDSICGRPGGSDNEFVIYNR